MQTDFGIKQNIAIVLCTPNKYLVVQLYAVVMNKGHHSKGEKDNLSSGDVWWFLSLGFQRSVTLSWITNL